MNITISESWFLEIDIFKFYIVGTIENWRTHKLEQSKAGIGLKRNVGVDLLRIVSMFMIIVLHSGSHGGINALSNNIDGYSIYFWLLTCFCIVGVNCFVLISGYFLSDKKFSVKSLVKHLVEVWFYSFFILLFTIIMKPEIINGTVVIKSLLPIITAQYWFISVYIELYMIFPFLNILTMKLTKKQYEYLILISSFFLSVCCIIPIADPGTANNGYSLIWFINLYFIGAYIRKFVNIDSMKTAYLIFTYIICCMCVFSTWLIIKKVNVIIGALKIEPTYFIRYNSVLVTMASVALFCLFAKKNVLIM